MQFYKAALQVEVKDTDNHSNNSTLTVTIGYGYKIENNVSHYMVQKSLHAGPRPPLKRKSQLKFLAANIRIPETRTFV